VWPENWPAVTTFGALCTQWRVGNSGPIGLDYNAIPTVLRLKTVPRKDWDDVFECIRVMEAAALEKIREKR
jgi:hypothetical protein